MSGLCPLVALSMYSYKTQFVLLNEQIILKLYYFVTTEKLQANERDRNILIVCAIDQFELSGLEEVFVFVS